MITAEEAKNLMPTNWDRYDERILELFNYISEKIQSRASQDFSYLTFNLVSLEECLFIKESPYVFMAFNCDCDTTPLMDLICNKLQELGYKIEFDEKQFMIYWDL